MQNIKIKPIVVFSFILCIILLDSCQEKVSGCTNPSASNYNPAANDDNGSCIYPTTFVKGNSYGGGIIFYIDSTGHHGLISSSSDQSSGIRWNNGTNIVTNSTGIAIGTGMTNTNSIVSVQGPGNYAAYVCDTLTLNGYADWFLPSLYELYILYLERNLVGGFNGKYWGSYELSFNVAGYQSFDIGMFGYGSYKDSLLSLRAIRSF